MSLYKLLSSYRDIEVFITLSNIHDGTFCKRQGGLGPFDKGTSSSGPFFPKSGHFFRFSKRAGVASPFLTSSPHESVASFPSISLNIPKYPWKCLNKQFWLCQGSKYAWLSYMFDKILKVSLVLNKPGFWIWHICICKGYLEFRIFLIMAPYASIMAKYVSICLNVP